MTYSFQTFTLNQILTSGQVNQIEVNVRDHIHGRNSVGKVGVSFPATAKSAGFTPAAADVGEMFNCTGTFSVTFTAAATLGNGWAAGFTNVGSGTITLDPNGAETIDGASTLDIGANESVIIYSDGVSLFTVGGGGGFHFIEAQSVSSVSTVQLGEGKIKAGYDYLVVARSVQNSTDRNPQLRIGTGAGPTYQTSGYVGSVVHVSTTTVTGDTVSTAGSEIGLIVDGATVHGGGATAGELWSANILIHDPAANDVVELEWSVGYHNNAGVKSAAFGAGEYTSAAVVTGFQIKLSDTGTMSGEFALLRRKVTA